MSRYHISSTSIALYRIFIAPTLASPGPFRLRHAFLLPQAVRFHSRPTPRGHKKKHIPVVDKTVALAEAFQRDNELKTDDIFFVHPDGSYHGDTIHSAFQKFDPTTHDLAIVRPGRTNEDGEYEPPFCKAFLKPPSTRLSKIEQRFATNRLTEKPEPGPKEMELNWAIEASDLKHRLTKLRDFLEDGRKVAITMKSKIKGRKATLEECRSLLSAVHEMVDSVPGTTEAAEPVGGLGGQMTLVFQGKKQENSVTPDTEQGKTNEAKNKKAERRLREEKKAERRRKQQEMDRRNEKLGDAQVAQVAA